MTKVQKFLGKILIVLLGFNIMAEAKFVSSPLEYKVGDQVYAGYITSDTKFKNIKSKPVVIMIHNWMGVNDYMKRRSEQVASLGYAAAVIDLFGQGQQPQNVDQAAKKAGELRSGDRAKLRERLKAAYSAVIQASGVSKEKISALGYCFGGTSALEMARIELPLKGVVTFHGGLSAVTPQDATHIKAPLLILHGAIDPYVPPAEVTQFIKELNDNKINYEFISYSGAVHSFTEKEAGTDITKGAAYNEQADRRSFVAMSNFLKEIFQ